MTTTCRVPATRPQTKPLDFDERLALAAVEIDTRINPQPFDLADVIQLPVEAPRPLAAPCPYRSPLAAVLHRARVRVESGGWCAGALRDEQGSVCLIGAIRAVAVGRDQAKEACAILREAIRRDFADAEIASWNDAQRDPRLPLLYLDRAAELAHTRGR